MNNRYRRFIAASLLMLLAAPQAYAAEKNPPPAFHFPVAPVAPVVPSVSPQPVTPWGQDKQEHMPWPQQSAKHTPDSTQTPAVKTVPATRSVAPLQTVQPLVHGQATQKTQELPPAFSRILSHVLATSPALSVLATQAGNQTSDTGSSRTTPEKSSGSAVSITDDTGHTITLQAPAKRIIALYGGFNEILAAMGQEHRLIARTKADTRPPTIEALPSIGTHMQPNAEIITALAPDCILQLGGRKQAAETQQELERLGFPVIFFQPASFSDLFSVIRRIGVLTDSGDKAQYLIADLQKRLDAVAQTVANAPSRPTVFFEVRYPNLLGAGGQSIVTDIIRHAGGSNVLQTDQKLVRLNEEELIRLNPQAYLMQRGPMNPTPVPLRERPHFSTLQAVTEGMVMEVDEQIFSRPGPRAVDAVEELARFLHPQAFDGAPKSEPDSGQ